MDRAISPDDLFNEWCNNQDEPWVLAMRLGIKPAQLADLADDPVFIKRVAAWERLSRALKEAVIFNHQQAAASQLRETMSSPDPIEARRAATVLARLCRNMQTPTASRTPAQNTTIRRGTALGDATLGGTALQSGASGDPNPPQDPPDSIPSAPTSPPPSTPSLPLTASFPLDLSALVEPRDHPTGIVATLAALAGTVPMARASSP